MTDPPIAEPYGDDNVIPEPGSKPSMPRWVRAFVIIAIILVLAAVVGSLPANLAPVVTTAPVATPVQPAAPHCPPQYS